MILTLTEAYNMFDLALSQQISAREFDDLHSTRGLLLYTCDSKGMRLPIYVQMSKSR